MTKHIVIDTETLGVEENAVILSIGAVAFTFDGDNNYRQYVKSGIQLKLDVEDQVRNYGRKIEDDTVSWWKKQSKEAQEILKRTPIDYRVADAMIALNAWLKQSQYDWKTSYIWTRGNAFDIPKLESLYKNAQMKCGFNTWMVRDVRTAIDILAGTGNGLYEPRDGVPAEFVAHNSLHDAAMDAFRMVELIQGG